MANPKEEARNSERATEISFVATIALFEWKPGQQEVLRKDPQFRVL